MASLDFSHLQKLLLSTGLQPSETFFPRLAERDNDGSRGLKPTVRGQAYHPASRERRRNGQTRRWRSTVAPRRVTTILPFRGLKSTATFRASLREARRGWTPAHVELELRAPERCVLPPLLGRGPGVRASVSSNLIWFFAAFLEL